MVTLERFITTLKIIPASINDLERSQNMTDGISGITLLGDKDYV